MIEEWKAIPEFEGYQVSNTGKVRGIDRYRKNKKGFCFLKGKELKQLTNKKGYLEVRFRKKGCHSRVVHRLVAIAFIPKIQDFNQVNHINGIKSDNRVENLEWVNNSINQLHAYKNGLQPSRTGENNSNVKITNDDVTAIKILYNSGKTNSEISTLTNINVNIVRDIIYGRSWKTNTIFVNRRDDRKKPIL